MERITCPHCSEVSAVDASLLGTTLVCGVCGQRFLSEAPVLPTSSAATRPTERQVWIQSGCFLIFVVVALLAYFGMKKMHEHDERKFEAEAKERAEFERELDRKYGPTADSGAQVEAWAQIQLFVEQRLTNPRSAKFPFGGHRLVVALGEDRYRVRSYVEATNSFGATVRTNFDGVLKRRSGGWDLESLTME